MGTQHIIELNGRRYDAQTGKIIPHSEVPVTNSTFSSIPQHSIDGFVKKKPHAPRKISNTNLAHHPVSKSSTLMRKAVSKPATVTALHGRRSGNASPTATIANPLIEHATATPPAERIGRAAQTKRSSLIQRFGSEISSAFPKKPHSPNQKPASHSPIAAVSQPIPEATSPHDSIIAAAISHSQPKLKKTPVHHKIARKMRVKPRTLNISAAVFAFLVLGGFFAYQNAPNLSMRVASMNAQVEGSIPRYRPAGFAISGPIKYQPGEIMVSYKSNSDSRGFQITQKSSAWDTESLRENYVATLKTPYQTVQDKGKTIYLYADSNATWVDAGVWYTIEGKSELNTDQVLKLAGSL